MITFNPKNESADEDDGQPDRGFEMLGRLLILLAFVGAYVAGCAPGAIYSMFI